MDISCGHYKAISDSSLSLEQKQLFLNCSIHAQVITAPSIPA